MFNFHGAWPALVTPFNSDDTINTTVLQDMVEYHLAKGVGGFYLCGSTGEGMSMSVAERKLVTEVALAQVNGRAPSIVHVGTVTARDAADLARHAAEHGAAGISSVLPPLFNNVPSLCAYFEMLAAAAPGLPLLPYLYGGPTDAVALMRQFMTIPTVTGAKYTGPNMYELGHIAALREDKWAVFSGMDEQCLFAAMSGACGNIGSTVNLMPGVYREIHKACQAGDLARGLELQQRANAVTATLIEAGLMGALKIALGTLGFPCGGLRLPRLMPDGGARSSLFARLEACGLPELTEL